MMDALTRKVRIPRYAFHLGHAATGWVLVDVLQDWFALSILVACVVGAVGGAALIEFVQHLREGTAGPERLRDRVADWWDYQAAWLQLVGAAGSLGAAVLFVLAWLVVYLLTLSWRRP